jgi:hypothetical protein
LASLFEAEPLPTLESRRNAPLRASAQNSSFQEAAMSDEPVSQSEDFVSRAEYENLQEQLKTTKADRDRQNFEKFEIVAKANAYAKERDDLKEQLASVLTERDQMIGDVVAEHDKLVADLTSARDALTKENASVAASLAEMTRRAEDAARRADSAVAEVARLRKIVDATPSTDPVELLWAVVTQKTKAAVAWIRSKIPADSPILPYFDKSIAVATQVGCAAVRLTREFIVWATPKAIELSKRGVAKVEELLAKK